MFKSNDPEGVDIERRMEDEDPVVRRKAEFEYFEFLGRHKTSWIIERSLEVKTFSEELRIRGVEILAEMGIFGIFNKVIKEKKRNNQ